LKQADAQKEAARAEEMVNEVWGQAGLDKPSSEFSPAEREWARALRVLYEAAEEIQSEQNPPESPRSGVSGLSKLLLLATLFLWGACAQAAEIAGLAVGGKDRVLAAMVSGDEEKARGLTQPGQQAMEKVAGEEVGGTVKTEVREPLRGTVSQVMGLARWSSGAPVAAAGLEGGVILAVPGSVAWNLGGLGGSALKREVVKGALSGKLQVARVLVGWPRAAVEEGAGSILWVVGTHPLESVEVGEALVLGSVKGLAWKRWVVGWLQEQAGVVEDRRETKDELLAGLEQVEEAVGKKAPKSEGLSEGALEEGRAVGVVGSWSGKILEGAAAKEGEKAQLVMLHVGSDLSREERGAYWEAVRGMVENARGSSRMVQFMLVLDVKGGMRLGGEERKVYEAMRKDLGIPESMMHYRYGAKSPEEAVEKYEQMKSSLMWGGAAVTILTMREGSWDAGLLKQLGGATLVEMREVALGLGQVEVRYTMRGANARAMYEGMKGAEGVEWNEGAQSLTLPSKATAADLAEGAVLEGLVYLVQQ
jgi:hypothetical protein